MVIVTSYKSPDLDGVACSIAYSEFLNKTGIAARATYYGDLGLEVDFVEKYTNNLPIEKHIGEYDSGIEFVLVDVADPEAIDLAIKLDKVKKIFDHRELVFTNDFINAKKHIELVGSCATLITEEFKKNNIIPTKNTAVYLYSAIISNTINFKNTVTTERDIQAAGWLKEIVGLDEDYTKQMFDAKSKIMEDNIYGVLFQDFAIKIISGKKVGIAQIEMVDADRMLSDLNAVLLETLHRFKEENKLDYLLFSAIDIIKGFNIFYTIDKDSEELFSKVLDISDFVPGYKTETIVMRKQIWPKLETLL